jgi:isopentenyl diphosphate isomerase/L-lactate dehydrogenase-like FMN-dependent dehydrogenase
MGERMTRLTCSDIREYVQSTSLPFILKGVLSAKDAFKAAECGVKGIVVSHHHGRLQFAVPPLMVLPEIRQAVAGTEDFTVFVDCGIDTGADAFKALALGADAVAVGRALMQPLIKEGAAGVEAYVANMNRELRTIMNYTGSASVAEISSDSLWVERSYIHQESR